MSSDGNYGELEGIYCVPKRKPVKNLEPCGVKKNRLNEVIFDPVTATEVCLQVKPQEILSKAGERGPPTAFFVMKDARWLECGVTE